MNISLYTKRNDRIKAFFERCREVRESLNYLRENWKPVISDDSYLTDKEVALKLRVTRRTLHSYRENGLIPYYDIGGKYLYSERDINSVMMKNYRSVFPK